MDIHGNKLTVDVAEALGKLTSAPNCHISTLLLHRNRFKNRGVQILCSALRQNWSVVVLNLEGNGITNDGADAVAEYVHNNETLTYINLTDNEISAAGTIQIAKALMGNSVMSHLLLSQNKIGNEGTVALSDILQHENCGLVHLEVNSCGMSFFIFSNVLGISDEGAVSLAIALTQNVSLLSLRLYNNHLSEDAGKALSELLIRNNTIVSIDIKGNQIDHSTYLKIKKTLKRNKVTKMQIEPNYVCLREQIFNI